MYLKSLYIFGFKSFAKKTVLHFNSPITAIVGPNGSGKSNVAEAFRFVLGEQSIKSMRGKRGEDLIWNGGGEAGRANRASIKLIFDNSKRIFAGIDFDEIAIERVVHRDNTNEYLLNDSQVRLKDITEMLAGAHIGVTGHHIISQGEADRVLSASHKERRSMIEDALGLRVHQWKKLESIRKLEKTQENMKQVQALKREIAPHIKFLKKQTDKIAKAEEWRKELALLYREYFARSYAIIKKQKQKLSSDISISSEELRRLETKLGQVVDENSSVSLDNQKSSVERDIGRLEGEINIIKRALNKEKEKSNKEETKTIFIKDIEELTDKIQGFGFISDAKQLLDKIINTLRDFVAERRVSQNITSILDMENEINKNISAKTELEKRLARIKESIVVTAKRDELSSDISSLNQKLREIEAQEQTLKREIGEAGVIAGREAVDFSSIDIVDDLKQGQEERRHAIEKLKLRLEDTDIGGGSEVLKEYRETEERDAFLGRELEDLEKASMELSKLITELDTRIDFEFRTGISKINTEFQKFFVLMFGGGKACISVVKETRNNNKNLDTSIDITNDFDVESFENNTEPYGLEVDVSLPRKKIKGLMMLSGGERALTSIALLFAISQVNPPPFIILDETDAALDEANSSKYGDMIENLSRHSQLILITHNRSTMSRAGVLYGVTMGSDGASRLLSISFEEMLPIKS